MPKLTLKSLGRKITERRGANGIRAAAAEIGVSPATLSRVERGNLPDLETFKKICSWLAVDPGEVLGFKPAPKTDAPVAVHFKKESAIQPDTARALAEMILAAQRAMHTQEANS